MIRKISYFGNPNIGLFAFCNDVLCITSGFNSKFVNNLEILKVPILETTIWDSEFSGLYIAGNKNGIALPNFLKDNEYKKIKDFINDNSIIINFQVIKTNFNAFGNNIAVNNKMCFINPDLKHMEKIFQDIFDVEVIAMPIAGYKTVGSTLVLGEKGFVITYKAKEQEKEELESMLNLKGKRTSVNLGSAFPKLGIIFNSKGLLIGETTTGIELANIIEGLDFNEG
jgi:translation initiation factor 6